MEFVRLPWVSRLILYCALLMLARCERVEGPPQFMAPPMPPPLTATIPAYGTPLEPQPHPKMQQAEIPHVPPRPSPQSLPSPEPQGAEPN